MKALAAAILVLLAPSAAAPEPAVREIQVTTLSDGHDGDTRSLTALRSDPGPDGISLREAIEVTSNDPGTYTIRFAPAVQGGTITVDSDLPPLRGGGVSVEGAGTVIRPAVDQAPTTEPYESVGLWVASGGNRLHGLGVEGFATGILIGPYWNDQEGPMPVRMTLADNVVGGLDIRATFGILVQTSHFCAAPYEDCWTYTTWKGTSITGNTIATDHAGIAFKIQNAGDQVEGATVTGNTIRIASGDAGIAFETAGESQRISDVLIARNTVEGSAAVGVVLAAGTVRGREGTVEHVQVLDNRVHVTSSVCWCVGVGVAAGSEDPVHATMSDPPRYPDGNLVRDVLLRGNAISGELDAGVEMMVGVGSGGRGNRASDVRIELNTIQTSKPGIGVFIFQADGPPPNAREATGDQVDAISIEGNLISTGEGPDAENAGGGTGAGGVVILAGGELSRGNAVRAVRITENSISTAYTGVSILGGVSPTARDNSVTCVSLEGNLITGAQQALSVVPNARGAAGNVASLEGCAGEPPLTTATSAATPSAPTPAPTATRAADTPAATPGAAVLSSPMPKPSRSVAAAETTASVALAPTASAASEATASPSEDGSAPILAGAALGAVALGALAIYLLRRA